MHVQLGQILDKRFRETKEPSCHFWRAHSETPPKGWANHRRHPSGLTPGLIPSLPFPHTRNKLACLRKQTSQGISLFLLPPAVAGTPVKLAWTSCLLLVHFYWLRRPRTLVGNTSLSPYSWLYLNTLPTSIPYGTNKKSLLYDKG